MTQPAMEQAGDAAAEWRRLVVIGTSAGGFHALRRLFAALPADLPAPLLVVQHISDQGHQPLAELLAAVGPLPVSFANGRTALHAGQVYLAPPDRHLLVEDGRLVTFAGPRENRMRPAIDPLFRSAAVAHGAAVIGVLLTGLLDDGTSGLEAVRRCGGVTIVQDPADAEYPDMIEHALERLEADHRVKLDDLPALLERLCAEAPPPSPPPPRDLVLEVEQGQRAIDSLETMRTIGDASSFSCPSCGGRLWQTREADHEHFRCEVGHAFGLRSLLAANDTALEQSLWVALRSLEERVRMLQRLAANEHSRNHVGLAATFESRAEETQRHIERIRHLLLEGF